MLLPLKLDRDGPLQQQLHDQLRRLIEAGTLPAGSRMPSTRGVAEQFGVSRMTVVLTYERLTAAGLLHTVPAGGTYVGIEPHAAPVALQDNRPPPPRPLADATGEPDPALFPTSRWRSLLRAEAARFADPSASDRTGEAALRKTLAKWLAGTRCLDVAPEQIVVVSARQRALEIAAHLLLRPGQRVVLEQPGDPLAASLFASFGARCDFVPVDEGGLVTQRLPGRPATLAYVTPGSQDALGVTLGPARRQALLAWAAAADAHIVEGDRIGDLRYDHELPRALMSEDSSGRVLCAGDLGAALGPFVTTGFLVVPRPLAAAAQAARHIFETPGSGLEWRVLAEFMEGSAWPRHLLRVRRLYAARREALLRALARHFPAGRPIGGAAGFTVAWAPPPGLGTASSLAEAATTAGLPARALQAVGPAGTVLFALPHADEHHMDLPVARFARLARPRAGLPDDRQAAD